MIHVWLNSAIVRISNTLLVQPAATNNKVSK